MNFLYLAVNVLLSIPYAALYILIAFILFGYKEKISVRNIITFVILIGLIDATLTTFIDPSGSINAPIELLLTIILLVVLFSIEILSSLVMAISGFLIYMFLCAPLNFLASHFIGFISGNPNSGQINQIANVLTMYIVYSIMGIILFILYKIDFKIINLRRFKAFNQDPELLKKQQETLKYILAFFIPLFICGAINYAMYIDSGNYAYSYFIVNFVAMIASSAIIFSLVRKILRLNFIESEYKLQQSYMKNIDRLLNDLRAQRHGFNNHVQTLFSLIQSQKYDSVKEYIAKMHEVISCKNNVLSVKNPTLCALLNAKTGYAQNSNVKFEVKMDNDLSEMNFSAYELVEVLGNVIDNAIEASSSGDIKYKYVNINISSDENHYIFSIENSGKTIPPQIIDKIFEEGFTTKQDESHAHGFGLYICKHILDVYNGKIDVLSKDNITIFKILLPRLAKNEFGLS